MKASSKQSLDWQGLFTKQVEWIIIMTGTTDRGLCGTYPQGDGCPCLRHGSVRAASRSSQFHSRSPECSRRRHRKQRIDEALRSPSPRRYLLPSALECADRSAKMSVAGAQSR
jgi:hypothetical protein